MITLKMIDSFKKSYEDPSKRLSFERAMKLDRNTTAQVAFSKDGYRQPVLVTRQVELEPYRRQQSEKLMCGDDNLTDIFSPSPSGSDASSFLSTKHSPSRKIV